MPDLQTAPWAVFTLDAGKLRKVAQGSERWCRFRRWLFRLTHPKAAIVLSRLEKRTYG